MGEVHIGAERSIVGVSLKNKSALVTGAASGIGGACAERLAHAGAQVTVLDLDGDVARQVADEIGGESLQADLSDYGVLNNLEIDATSWSTMPDFSTWHR